MSEKEIGISNYNKKSYLTPRVLHRRSQKSIIWQPERNLEPPSLPLTRRRCPYPLPWTTPCKRWVVFSNWWYTQSSTSSVVVTWLQDLHLKIESITKM